MPSFSKNDVVLVRYPFSDLSNVKIRPAVVVSAPHASVDYFVVPFNVLTTAQSSCLHRLRQTTAPTKMEVHGHIHRRGC